MISSADLAPSSFAQLAQGSRSRMQGQNIVSSNEDLVDVALSDANTTSNRYKSASKKGIEPILANRRNRSR